MSTAKEYVDHVLSLEKQHIAWRSTCLNMIASENVASPMVRGRLSTDLQNRYVNVVDTLSSNWKVLEKVRGYEGLQYVEEIEKICQKLLKRLFEASYVDYRPISGGVAILANWLTLSNYGDTIVTTSARDGGHGSGWDDAAILLGRKNKHWPFDGREYIIDVEKAEKTIKQLRPKLCVFGASEILFPPPVRELKDVAEEVGAHCVCDGSHVMGLIAGKHFQDPLRYDVTTLFGSTHKTFPGPQGGIILSNADRSLTEKLDRNVCPTILGNYHQHRMAALTIAAAEMIAFGQEYAYQTIKNAQALGQALHEIGFTVLCEHKGFTQTHQILLDVQALGLEGGESAETLAESNIITSKTPLPGDKDPNISGGIRLGTSELTRLGMRESEMKHIAEFFKKCLIDMTDPKHVAEIVKEFTGGYRKMQYSFCDDQNAY